MGRGERTQPLGRRGWGRAGTAPGTAGDCSLSVMCVRVAGGPRCCGFTFSQIGGMMWAMANVRMIKHEVIPDCGSFEVRHPDGRPSQGQFPALECLRDGSVGACLSFVSKPLSSRIAHSRQLCVYSLRRAAASVLLRRYFPRKPIDIFEGSRLI